MNILIADSFPDTHRLELENLGHRVTMNPDLDEHTLTGAIGDHDILVVRSTRVNAATLDAGTGLRLVVRAGAGTNTIDCARAASRGIRVCNVPGANALAVAELVLGLIICIDRNLADNVADLRNGIWNKKKYSKSRGLCGQKLGILGMGAIGLAVAERARAFGMQVFAVHRDGRDRATAARMSAAGTTELESQEALLEECDIVTIHLPATEKTRGMVNGDFLARMKPGAMLINSSRGELVDEAALLHAIETRGIRAGLDVYHNEPAGGEGDFESAIARHPAVCGTHHIGASTAQAQTAVADGVVAIIQAFENGEVRNCVNS